MTGKENRIYISGAITNNPSYKQHFASAQIDLEEQGYAVINPAMIASHIPEDMTDEEYLYIDLNLLSICDSIYMLKGWEKSCGANREYGYALATDKIIIFEK